MLTVKPNDAQKSTVPVPTALANRLLNSTTAAPVLCLREPRPSSVWLPYKVSSIHSDFSSFASVAAARATKDRPPVSNMSSNKVSFLYYFRIRIAGKFIFTQTLFSPVSSDQPR